MRAEIIGLVLIHVMALSAQPIEEANVVEESQEAASTTLEPWTEPDTTELPTIATDDPDTTLPPPVLCDPGEAFLPAPQCNEFYMCLHGVGILKTCPHGLYWDPSLSVCNWDESRCDNQLLPDPELPANPCSSGVEFLPVEADCTQYIQCVHNAPIERSCPPSLYWNQPLQRCDYLCES